MGLFNNFPYTNFHELNLDWLLQTVKKLGSKIDELVELVNKRGVPSGGSAGQVLTKNSDDDFDTAWTAVEGNGGEYLPLDGGVMNDGAFIVLPGGSVKVVKDENTASIGFDDEGNSNILLTNGDSGSRLTMKSDGVDVIGNFSFRTAPTCDAEPVNGNELVNKAYVDANAGGGELEVASYYSLGGVKAPEKTDSDTVPIRIDPNTGFLYSTPGDSPENSAAVGTGKVYEFNFPYVEEGGTVTIPSGYFNSVLTEANYGIIDVWLQHQDSIEGSLAVDTVPVICRTYYAAGGTTEIPLYGISKTDGITFLGTFKSTDFTFTYADGIRPYASLSDTLCFRWYSAGADNVVSYNIN
jgi:hypothetical protein